MKKRYGNELHPVYKTWLSINQRCNNPKSTNYIRYGAIGIKLDYKIKDFKSFANYVESLPDYINREIKKLSLDRINPYGNYEIGNLRWADSSTQIANQKNSGKGFNKYTGINWSKVHNRWIARINFKGKTLFSKSCLTEEEAVNERNNFIIKNSLPHKINKI